MRLAGEDFLAIATTDGKAGDQRIFLAAKLSKAEIAEHFAGHIETRDVISLGFARAHGDRQPAGAFRRACSSTTSHCRRPIPKRLADAMLIGIREMGLAALPWSEGDQRLRGARGLSAPAFSRRGLARSLG